MQALGDTIYTVCWDIYWIVLSSIYDELPAATGSFVFDKDCAKGIYRLKDKTLLQSGSR
jgi:hypothetical protein